MHIPVPKEVTDALKGVPQMHEDLTQIRALLARLVELQEEVLSRPAVSLHKKRPD